MMSEFKDERNFFNVNIPKRTVAAVLVLLLVCGALAGCGISNKAVMKYGDYAITEPMYSYWLSKYKTSFLSIYNNAKDTESFWNTEIEGQDGFTYADFAENFVNEYAKQVLISMQLFDDYGLSFTDEQKEEIEKRISDLIESYGGKNLFNETLGEMGLNIKTLQKIYYAEEKYVIVCDYLFGENGILAVSDNDREAYYKENYYCAEWIYVYTEVKLKMSDDGKYYTDSNGVYIFEKLTDAEKAEQAEKLLKVEKALAAGDDFSEVREKYTEEGLDYTSTYPDGIILSPEDYTNYGADMIKAIQSLEIGEYTKFNNGYATVIVKRRELKNYSLLTKAELELMLDFEDYVYDEKTENFFNGFDVKVVDGALDKYDIRTIAGAKNTSI